VWKVHGEFSLSLLFVTFLFKKYDNSIISAMPAKIKESKKIQQVSWLAQPSALKKQGTTA